MMNEANSSEAGAYLAHFDPNMNHLVKSFTLEKSLQTVTFEISKEMNALFEDPSATIELELRCFFTRDGPRVRMWPEGIRLSCNETEVKIPAGIEGKPLHIKKYSVVGNNVLTITKEDEHKGYSIVLRLVRLLEVSRLVNFALLERNLSLVDAHRAIAKAFNVLNKQLRKTSPRITSLHISLICPLSGDRIKVAARGKNCHHIQCFNLRSFLSQDMAYDEWTCPICFLKVNGNEIFVDSFIQNVVEQLRNTDIEAFILHDTLDWEPFLTDPTEEEKEAIEKRYVRLPFPKNSLINDCWYEICFPVEQFMFSVFSTELFSRADLEVEVQCYKGECEQNHSLYPLCLEINSQHFFVKWEKNDTESLDVRKCLVWGKNILSTIAHKLCKHNIALFLVHRPTIDSVLNHILPRDLLPSVHTRKRIKKIVRGGYFLPLSRICPISKTKMEFPVRFPGCKHLKCFDMLNFLELISDIRNNWMCPICNLKPAVKRFEVDEFLLNILNKTQKEGEIFIVNVKDMKDFAAALREKRRRQLASSIVFTLIQFE